MKIEEIIGRETRRQQLQAELSTCLPDVTARSLLDWQNSHKEDTKIISTLSEIHEDGRGDNQMVKYKICGFTFIVTQDIRRWTEFISPPSRYSNADYRVKSNAYYKTVVQKREKKVLETSDYNIGSHCFAFIRTNFPNIKFKKKDPPKLSFG